MSNHQIRARAELERRRRGIREGGLVFYDPDDPEEPERSIQENPTTAFFLPEEQDEEELKAANCEFDKR